jgi:predicted Fe-Mo cluster-binding NifX family protein
VPLQAPAAQGSKPRKILPTAEREAVITPRCGENAAKILKAAKVTLYKNINHSIRDNLEALKEGNLNLLGDIHPGFHRHGGNE